MFRIECLRPAAEQREPTADSKSALLFYEMHGEEQVRSGNYHLTIRYREHILPLAEAMSEHLERTMC